MKEELQEEYLENIHNAKANEHKQYVEKMFFFAPNILTDINWHTGQPKPYIEGV